MALKKATKSSKGESLRIALKAATTMAKDHGVYMGNSLY
jgi:hypothetical protein